MRYAVSRYVLFSASCFDRVAAVFEDALLAVDVGDRAAARGGVREGGVVGHQAEVVGVGLDLAEVHRADGAVADRQLVGLAGAVVGDGEGVRHDRYLLVRLMARPADIKHPPTSAGVNGGHRRLRYFEDSRLGAVGYLSPALSAAVEREVALVAGWRPAVCGVTINAPPRVADGAPSVDVGGGVVTVSPVDRKIVPVVRLSERVGRCATAANTARRRGPRCRSPWG